MKLYLHQKQIENRIHELAHEVNDAHCLDDSPFVMVGILNGGFMVFSEFVKHLNIHVECDFIRAKSYKGKKQSKENLGFTRLLSFLSSNWRLW